MPTLLMLALALYLLVGAAVILFVLGEDALVVVVIALWLPLVVVGVVYGLSRRVIRAKRAMQKRLVFWLLGVRIDVK